MKLIFFSLKNSMKDIYIFGTGNQAKVLFRIINSQKQYIFKYFVSDKMNKKIFLNKKIISLNEFMKIKENTNIFIAIGENLKRKKIFNLIKKKKKNNFPNIFYEKKKLIKNVKFGIGNLVMPGCIINNDVKIENFCILNTGSIIEHDCKIGSFNSISPGAVLSGNCETKEDVFIGSNATIIHNIKIGKKTVIGAGTVVTKNVEDNSRIVGSPNRKIKQKINYL